MAEDHNARTPHDDRPELTVSNIAKALFTTMVEEYDSRTRFGKLLYPFWLLKGAYIVIGWAFIIGFVGSMVYLIKAVNADWGATIKEKASLPAIHKDE